MRPEQPAGTPAAPIRVCFVCTGNICRSPTAEVVLRARLAEAGWADGVVVDSAGTGPWHVGKDMDPRARQALARRGYAPPVHMGRQFAPADFAGRDPAAVAAGELEIADPYYDGDAEFETTLAQIEAACAGLAQLLDRRLRAAQAEPAGSEAASGRTDGAEG